MLLELTFNELLYIDDVVTVSKIEYYLVDGAVATDYAEDETLRGLAGSAEIAVPIDFVLKIGSAILQIMEETDPADLKSQLAAVDVNEQELWLLREIAQSDLMIGSDFIGLQFKQKIHRALRDIINKEIADEMSEELGFSNGG